MLAAVDIL
ncbi:hypothetical protein D021_2844A, partial [Vibrio parahaemolyticus 10296]